MLLLAHILTRRRHDASAAWLGGEDGVGCRLMRKSVFVCLFVFYALYVSEIEKIVVVLQLRYY